MALLIFRDITSYNLEQPIKSVVYSVTDKINQKYDSILEMIERVPYVAGKAVRLLVFNIL